MKKRHLVVAVVAVLALSSSTIASAEGGSHRKISGFDHVSSVAPIALSNSGGVLTIDTSTAVPSFTFDIDAVSPHIDFDALTLTTHFDTSTATSGFDDEPGVSDDGEGDDGVSDDDELGVSDDDELGVSDDDELGVSDDGEGDDEFLPAGIPVNPGIPPAGLATPVGPVDPNAPATPATPSWITKPHAKSNDDNRDHPQQSSDESED